MKTSTSFEIHQAAAEASPFTCRDPSRVIPPTAGGLWVNTHVQRAQGLRGGPCFSRDRRSNRTEALGPGGATAWPPGGGGRLDPPGLLGFLAQCFGAPRLGWSIHTGRRGFNLQGLIQAAVRHEGQLRPHACTARSVGLQLLPGRVLAVGLRPSPAPRPLDEQERI